MISSLFILLLTGLVVGFFAGLLGIGGGAIMVPALTAYFLWQGFDTSVVVHLALATSMSCIVFNALISIRTHQKHHAILWSIFIQMAPAVLIGSTLATVFVLKIESKSVALVFMVLMFLVAIQMVVNFKPKPSTSSKLNKPILLSGGFIIGLLSAMIAIGGGSLTVPFLHWYQVKIPKAIATAAAIGLPLALSACVVYIIQGWHQGGLPPHTIGYIYWPATCALCLGSVFTTSIGANLTHRWPVKMIKRIFALLISLLAIKMYFTF